MSAPEISPPTTCTSCGVPLRAASASRVCPACVLRLAMADDGTAGAQIAADLPPEAEISSATVGSLGMVRYFGDYELLDEIARGGMGVVYRAMQLSLHRPVALKMILAGHLASEETMARFRLEASAAARLRHPNIVSVYEVGAHEGQQFFSMEFVGGSLAREMDRFCIPRVADGSAAALKLRHQKVAELMQKIAGALAVAHERGVLHRDVKPGNILLAENDEPKLGDFGLAKQLGHESSLTLSTAVLGSPSYMAPEQTRGGNSSLTTAVDIYGLGAVLYELLTGRPPFQGGNALDTMRQVQHDAPVAPSKLVSKVDLDLETICLKCLEKAPSDRYDSARAVAEELGRVLRKEPILARPVSRMVHLWRWSGRNPKLSAALVALLVALLVGVSGIVWQWRAAEQARSLQAQALMETKAANTAQALSLEHLRWGEVDRWLERREPAPALAQLARFLRERPEDWRAAMYAMSIVDQHSFCFKASPSVEAGVDSSSYAKLSPDAKWIVYSTNMHTIHVREAATGKEVKTITQPAEYPKLRMLKAALTGEKLDPLAHFRAHALNANNQLALCTQDGGITVRAIPEGEIIPLIRATPKDPLVDLAFTSNGEYLIGHTGEGSVEMWKVNALRQNPMVFNLSAGVTDAIPSADGSIILVWNPEEGVVAEGATGNEITRLKAVQKFVFGTISGDGTRVALVEMQSVTRVWDVPDRRELPAMPVMPSYCCHGW